MTDNGPGVSAIINSDVSTPEGAMQQRDRLMADEAYRADYLKGDPAKVAEITGLYQTATKQPTPAAEADSRLQIAREQQLDAWSRTADIPPAVADMVRNNAPVSEHEKRLATAEKQRLFQDKDWIKRYLDGGRAERSRMAMISIILAAPTEIRK